MGIKVNFTYKRSSISSVLLLAFLLIFVSKGSDFNFKAPEAIVSELHHEAGSSSIQGSDNLLGDHDLLTTFKASAEKKIITYRKKLRRIIEVNDDHSLYVKDVQYSYNTNACVNLNYESPHFVTQQESFLFRLTVF
jgi:hypothetical protein